MTLTNTLSTTNRTRYLYVFTPFIGALMVMAFAPLELTIIQLVCFGYLFHVYTKVKTNQATLIGLLFGFGMFGSCVWWVYISIHDYGHTHYLFAGFITLIFILYLSIFTAIHGYICNKFTTNNSIGSALIFASGWTLIEWLRGWLLTGFPWAFIGYSQANTLYGSLLPILGVLGTSFVIVFQCCLISAVILHVKKIQLYYLHIVICILITVSSYFLSDIQWTKTIIHPIKVSVVQPNIDQDIKWTQKQIVPTLELYYKLSMSKMDSDLIVWPEAAIPLTKNSAKYFLSDLSDNAKKNDVGILLGIPITKNKKIYNGAIGIGSASGDYLKQFLVPFGEFIPLKPILEGYIRSLNIPMGEFEHGSSNQQNLIYKNFKIAPFICYEVAYSDAFLDFRKDAHIFLTLSNDAWFGESIALDQHLQIAIARSRQTNRYHIVATNTGLTAVINPFGRLIAKLAPFEVAILEANVNPVQGHTPWSLMGNNPILILMALILILAIIYGTAKEAPLSNDDKEMDLISKDELESDSN